MCGFSRVGLAAPESRCCELHHLHGDLDGEPVVAPEVEPRELADPPQPLAQRVRMDVQRLRRRADRAVPAEELLERREELRAALRVVLGELPDGVDRRVADAAVDGDAQEVLVRAEIVVGEHGRLPGENDRADERLLRLGEAVGERRLALAHARHADRDGLGRARRGARRSRSRKRLARRRTSA